MMQKDFNLTVHSVEILQASDQVVEKDRHFFVLSMKLAAALDAFCSLILVYESYFSYSVGLLH